MAPSITFTVALLSDGAMSSIPIDCDVRAVFGKARPPVVVAINGYSYRSTIMTMAGVTFVPLRTSNREAAGVVQGGAYEVTLTLDEAVRDVVVPEALGVALEAAGVHEGWERLSFTTRREHVEGIVEAKREETRGKRIAAAVAAARNK